jgi:hypothetical protein
MVFLNNFQLPVRYDVSTELLAKFEQMKADHISDHIQEWRRQKSLIKVPIPPSFMLECFIKSLVPQVSKDVAMSGVFSEEEAIMRAHQLEMIYSQSGLLYEILPDAPRSILDKTRQKSGPHVDGIVDSAQVKPADQLSNQLQQLSIQETIASQTIGSTAPPTQTSNVHSVQLTNPKSNQQADGKKNRRKKGKGDKKPTNNAGGGNTKRKISKYLYNLCMKDHPTHLFPGLTEAQNLLVQQQLDVLTNPFPHGKNLIQDSANADGGYQGPPSSSSNPSTSNVYMLKVESHIATREHDYEMSSTAEKGKEFKNPSIPL